MRTWINIRTVGDRWEVAYGDERMLCRTQEEAEKVAQSLANLRWTEDNVLMGVRLELDSGAGGVTLYGP